MRIRKEITPISSRDKEFFNKLYEENKRLMFYIARKYASSQADCEDIVQDSIERLLKSIPRLRELNRNGIAKYIVYTVRAAFLDNERRKHGVSKVFLDDETLEALIKADLVIADSMPDISARLDVERLKKELPPRDWFVLEGKYYMGYSQEELSQMIGVSPDSIRMILTRAKGKARKILKVTRNGGDKNE